ncbi:hypothetical protein FQA47_022151 [Oryzias melastigma]|uniref:Uncharacterized protein n=1 Tax=Oryzias melastigma TaxID=30732 RepID=A0A834FMZ1_ORYME|nr:hypothetical protein FQA47_022151 [Oryzias melastigma]
MKIQIVSMLLLLSAEDIFGLDFYGKHVVKVWEGFNDGSFENSCEIKHFTI